MAATDPKRPVKKTIVYCLTHLRNLEMKTKSYSVLAGTTIALHVVWFLLPQVEWRWLSEDELVILSYSGFGSSIPVAAWLSWSFFAATLMVLATCLIAGPKARHLLLAYFIGTLVVFVPFGGIVSETGFSMALRDTSNLLIGAMIAIAYTTTVGVESKTD